MTKIHDLPGYLIRRLQQLAVSVFAARVAQAGFDLTPVQFAALATLADHPGIDQATLASHISYDRATIGGVIDRLCEKGLVRRNVNPRDKRARLLELTAEGQNTLTRITPVVQEVQHNILAGLSGAERSDFLAALHRLTDTPRPEDIPASGPAPAKAPR